MKTRYAAASLLAALSFAGAASAATVIHGVDSSLTATILHGGDRELLSMGFNASPTVFTGANLLHFSDGTLTNNVGTFGWNDPIPRDLDFSSEYSGNPDRADISTPYAGEGAGTGTLREVFGPFGHGYKNLSYIIDGEDDGAWHMDLFFAAGLTLSADADDSTVEIAILERGRNSDFRLYGIRADHSLTPGIRTSANLAAAGWDMDTLEVYEDQPVGGVGLSLDPTWTNLIGFRIEADPSFGGPDIIAVGTAAPVPAPGAFAAGMAGGALLLRRRRR